MATLGFNWKYNIIWILFTFGVLLVPVAPPDPLVADDALAITAVSADKHWIDQERGKMRTLKNLYAPLYNKSLSSNVLDPQFS